jgi:flagellar biosynthesis anti-sigma factor FlgM
MKIENNGISALTPKPTDPALKGADATQRPEKKTGEAAVSAVNRSHDKADLSEQARLLARSRAALETSPEAESEQVQKLRSQVQNGDYTIQVEAIVKRLAAGIFAKS